MFFLKATVQSVGNPIDKQGFEELDPVIDYIRNLTPFAPELIGVSPFMPELDVGTILKIFEKLYKNQNPGTDYHVVYQLSYISNPTEKQTINFLIYKSEDDLYNELRVFIDEQLNESDDDVSLVFGPTALDSRVLKVDIRNNLYNTADDIYGIQIVNRTYLAFSSSDVTDKIKNCMSV